MGGTDVEHVAPDAPKNDPMNANKATSRNRHSPQEVHQ